MIYGRDVTPLRAVTDLLPFHGDEIVSSPPCGKILA
jgi:hypothetical protein